MRSRVALAAATVLALCASLVSLAAGSADTPPSTVSAGTQPGSPWPTMRHDLRNTGASDLVARDPGTEPWSVTTGRGIFSTPVVAADGTIYVGSADHTLYGLDRTGRVVWRYRTQGIIDTAPALLAPADRQKLVELLNTLVLTKLCGLIQKPKSSAPFLSLILQVTKRFL